MMDAFTSRYPNVIHGWSYKTNYLNAICNIFHQEGSWAEVVSDYEYQKARALGVPGDRILFNGPFKPRPILEQAVRERARIHVDHLDELFLLEEVAREQNQRVPVTIRLNFETGFTDPWHRFGFNVESGQAMNTVRRIAQSPHLRLMGLHSHIGTFILEPLAYQEQVRILCDFMEAAEAITGEWIEYLDIGGGFASRNALQGIYLPPEQAVPDIETYAEKICSALLLHTRRREIQGKPRPTLFLETGRAMVDDTGLLISTVFATKVLPDGRRAAIMDAGVNLLFTSYWFHHRVRPTTPLPGVPEETILYGPLCMNIDVMRASVHLPPLHTGDVLVFSPIGAYNNTQWMQFIQYRPNVVMVDRNGNPSVIRRAETLDDINTLEQLPDHLRVPFPD
jgi:diaminopimelate decarboxylase